MPRPHNQEAAAAAAVAAAAAAHSCTVLEEESNEKEVSSILEVMKLSMDTAFSLREKRKSTIAWQPLPAFQLILTIVFITIVLLVVSVSTNVCAVQGDFTRVRCSQRP